MSRTYRKDKFTTERSLVQEINRNLERHKIHPYRTVKVRMSKDEIKAENDRRWKEYHREVAKYAEENNLSIEQARKATRKVKFIFNFWSQSRLIIPEPWPCFGYNYVKVDVTEEEVIEEAKRDYAKYKRDGRWNETGRNTYFKQLNKKRVRNEWKKAKHQILRSEDYDYDKPYPGDYMGKQHFWDVW